MNEIMVGIVALVLLLFLFATGIELGFAMALDGVCRFCIPERLPSCHATGGQRCVRCHNKLWVYCLSSLYPHGPNRL